MAWDLSADREREQMESLRNAWLEREEVILNHLRVSAAMFRWGYRILGIIAALVAAIMLAVGLIERNLIVVLFGVVLIYKEIKLCKLKFNGSYVSAYAEVEAAVAAVRRGESGSFPPEYTPDTQKLREPMLGAICGKLAAIAGFPALLRGRIRRNGGFGHRFCSGRCGFQGVFLAVCPSERPFCAHRGAVRGGGRRIRQERLGSQEAIRKGEWIEWKIHGAKIRNMPCARRGYALS